MTARSRGLAALVFSAALAASSCGGNGSPSEDAVSAPALQPPASAASSPVSVASAPVVTPPPPSTPDTSLSDFERRLVNLPADTWYEVPASQMRSVCAPSTFGVHAVMGCAAIVEAWGGGAYDPDHRKMLVWGGGHNDYWGNEVYSFDMRRGQWERLNDPSPGYLYQCDPARDNCAAPTLTYATDPLRDGKPNSRHTYDGLQYITHARRFFAQGGSRAPGGGGTAVTWLFDVDTLQWTHPVDDAGPGGYSNASGYDPVGGLVIVRSGNGLWSYDVTANAWTQLAGFGARPLWPRYAVSGNLRGAVDSRRGLFWSVGANDVLVWDIARATMVTNDWATTGGGAYTNEPRVRNYPEQVFTTGGGDILNANSPGFDYDAKADQFVAWKGGAPYVLDLATKTWTVKSAAGAPASQASNGTYGRWRFIAKYNVFVLVNGVSSNVYFYKNTPGGP